MIQSFTRFADRYGADLAREPWFKHYGKDRAGYAHSLAGELAYQLFDARHTLDKACLFRVPKRRAKPTLAEIVAAIELLAGVSAGLRADPP